MNRYPNLLLVIAICLFLIGCKAKTAKEVNLPTFAQVSQSDVIDTLKSPTQTLYSNVEESAKANGIKLPDRPWHLMVIWWKLTNPITDFNRFDTDITIDRDISEDYNLYISPINGALNGARFYGGLQTNINGWEDKKSRERVHRGKGGIFSRWSSNEGQPIGLEHVDKYGDGLCESAGYEGEFCSVRRPFKWTKGTYTLTILKEETINFKEKQQTWFKMSYTSHADGSVRDIGRLLFEGKTFEFRRDIGAFVEIYATGPLSKSNIPEAVITFGCPRINGVEQPIASVRGNYSVEGITASPNCADVIAEGKNISIHISPNVRPQPRKLSFAIPI